MAWRPPAGEKRLPLRVLTVESRVAVGCPKTEAVSVPIVVASVHFEFEMHAVAPPVWKPDAQPRKQLPWCQGKRSIREAANSRRSIKWLQAPVFNGNGAHLWSQVKVFWVVTPTLSRKMHPVDVQSLMTDWATVSPASCIISSAMM